MTDAAIHIAILLNDDPPYKDLMKASFVSSILKTAPNAEIDFYDPIMDRGYPDPATYALIILSGGVIDPMGEQPWQLEEQRYIRDTVAHFPLVRLLGIGWGHQTIAVAFGGRVGTVEKAEIGITKIELTLEGKVFLNRAQEDPEVQRKIAFDPFRIYQFERCEVVMAGERFLPLAAGNQMLECSESPVDGSNCNIVTIQGHPEMNEELAKVTLINTPGYMDISDSEKASLMQSLEEHHDGEYVWRAIVDWVMSERRRSSPHGLALDCGGLNAGS